MNCLDVLDSSKRVLVIGDLVLDKYVYGTCSRLAQECPMPIFAEESQEFRLGGAGNVVNNLRAMGVDVDLLTVVGEHADTIKELLSDINVSLNGLVELPGYQVKTNTRYITNDYQCFRADNNAGSEISRHIKREVAEKTEQFLEDAKYEVLIISDYQNGIFDSELAQKLITLANKCNTFTLVDAHRGGYERFLGATYIKTNADDARYFSRPCTDSNTVQDVCKILCEKLNIRACIISLREREVYMYVHGDKKFGVTPALPAQTSGGYSTDDVIVAALAFGIAHKQTLTSTCRFAQLCAANVIQRPSAVVVMEGLISSRVLYGEKHVRNLKRFLTKDKVVVLTTGCFDILHVGHVAFLQEAKDLGDYLIVALNSDVSVKKNKGATRPIFPLQQRLLMLQATKYVDFIVLFDEKRPEWVVELLAPDILVKGTEYTEERIRRSYPTLWRYVAIPLVPAISTTATIKRIKQA